MWMPTTLNTALSGAGARLFALLGLPRLPPLQVDPASLSAYEEFTSRHIDRPGGLQPLRPPGEPTSYLRWLAASRRVLFHGSQRDSITELKPDRESGDSTEFGNQRAVFATGDPVWAMWFALLVRGPELRSTRNGVWSIRRERRHRQYFFSVDSERPSAEQLTDGWLYVLPRDGFTAEPAVGGLLQSGQWVNHNPVKPSARIAVTPHDFPFTDVIGRHSADESMLRTLRKARHAYRRRVTSRRVNQVEIERL
jgi:hypothetical protein